MATKANTQVDVDNVQSAYSVIHFSTVNVITHLYGQIVVRRAVVGGEVKVEVHVGTLLY